MYLHSQHTTQTYPIVNVNPFVLGDLAVESESALDSINHCVQGRAASFQRPPTR